MSEFDDEIIRASEISQYVYCNRAWWLRRVHGMRSGNIREMTDGTVFHETHSRRLASAGLIRRAAYILLAAAIFIMMVRLIWG